MENIHGEQPNSSVMHLFVACVCVCWWRGGGVHACIQLCMCGLVFMCMFVVCVCMSVWMLVVVGGVHACIQSVMHVWSCVYVHVCGVCD